MKILMMSNTYLPIVGGLEKSIQMFTRHFRKLGHDVLIVVPQLNDSKNTEEGVFEIPALRGFYQSDFPVTLPFPELISKVIEGFNPDVIHAHHPFLLGEIAVRAAAEYRKPLIYTYHIRFDQYEHYLPLPPLLSRTFLVELSVGFANLSNRVIAPSESIRDLLLEQGVKKPIDVVPTGTNTAEFEKGDGLKFRKQFGIPADVPLAGYVGRLAREKNLEFLLEALIQHLRTAPTHVVIAGTGPMEDVLREKAAHAGIAKRVHFTGVLRRTGLADAYHAMDAFVFASKSETQGLVLCEALAAGVPVVALDAPGVREVVRDFKHGRLVKRESSVEFCAALRECLAAGKDRADFKQEAEKTLRLFAPEICAERALQVYEKAIASGFSDGDGDHTKWHKAVARLKAEWKLFSNLTRATSRAVAELTRSQ